MPSIYLHAAEYPLYGLPVETGPEQVLRASSLIDSYCHRPEGFLSADGQVMDETGDPIVEEQDVPVSARIVLSRVPIVTLLKIELRAGTAVRDEALWESHTALGADPRTGAVFLPVGITHPGRLRVTYVAGWTYAKLPAAIKLAAATLILRSAEAGGLGPNVKKAAAGDASMEWRSGSLMDDELVTLLARYRRILPL